MAGRRKKHKGGHEDSHVDERWLLTYADLITLLMSLFMVLWSISSVNISKFESLQRSLAEAFSGRIADGGQGIKDNGGSNAVQTPAENTPMATLQDLRSQSPVTGRKNRQTAATKSAQASLERSQFNMIKRQVEAIAAKRHLSKKIKVTISADGLHIRITTDNLLFDSGSAVVKPGAQPVLRDIAHVLAAEGRHRIEVQGNTDDVPVSGRYASNWNLSVDRAANVVNVIVRDGVAGGRMRATGFSEYNTVASNRTGAGRQLNRRVELFLPRQILDSNKAPSLSESAFPARQR